MNKPIITVNNLSKAYRLGLEDRVADTVVGAVTNTLTAPLRNWKNLQSLDVRDGEESDDILWALKDLNLEVQEGDVVGIIGRNGAGKSTLLKILSRITEPTSGYVRLRGRVSSLLEVGTGFHPELSGRDNIYMNGTILGMTKTEIDRKFDEIVDFSGVERFLDTPVKRYSSGMQVRLAFAVAAHLEPEILIVDEVLAVGDATFQDRCIKRMHELANSGRTILFVSHNLDMISLLCRTGVLLDRGRFILSGQSSEVVKSYQETILDNSSGSSFEGSLRNKRARFKNLMMRDRDGGRIVDLTYGDDLILEMDLEASESITNAAIAVNIVTLSGTKILSAWTREKDLTVNLHKGTQRLSCQFPTPKLRPGHRFAVSIWMESGEVLDRIEEALLFNVIAPRGLTGVSTSRQQSCIVGDANWRIDNAQ
jgi:lipopolysaccharide transport system ATP-binding protein